MYRENAKKCQKIGHYFCTPAVVVNLLDWTSGVDKIAVDWITGNLYVAGWTWDIGGISPTYIAVCDPEGTHCVRIAEGFEAYSLVLDPNEG